MLTSQQTKIMETVKNNTCKYCERIVLAGPPCCYQALYDLWLASQKEVKWLRKIQGKQTRRIQDLLEDLEDSEQEIPQCRDPNSTLITVLLFLVAMLCFRH